jgi:citrate lyase beta subunit
MVPGHRPRWIDAALGSAADLVVLDLEDGVPHQLKSEAARNVELLRRSGRPWGVRLCPGVDVDLEGAHAVMVPKVEEAQRPSGVPVVVTVETPRGMLALEPIARSCRSVDALAFGAEDYRYEMGGLASDALAVQLAGARVAEAARAFGLPVFETPCFRLPDTESRAVEALAMGMTGMGCIHPEQVSIVNDVFSPRRMVALAVLNQWSGEISSSPLGVVHPPRVRWAGEVCASSEQR